MMMIRQPRVQRGRLAGPWYYLAWNLKVGGFLCFSGLLTPLLRYRRGDVVRQISGDDLMQIPILDFLPSAFGIVIAPLGYLARITALQGGRRRHRPGARARVEVRQHDTLAPDIGGDVALSLHGVVVAPQGRLSGQWGSRPRPAPKSAPGGAGAPCTGSCSPFDDFG